MRGSWFSFNRLEVDKTNQNPWETWDSHHLNHDVSYYRASSVFFSSGLMISCLGTKTCLVMLTSNSLSGNASILYLCFISVMIYFCDTRLLNSICHTSKTIQHKPYWQTVSAFLGKYRLPGKNCGSSWSRTSCWHVSYHISRDWLVLKRTFLLVWCLLSRPSWTTPWVHPQKCHQDAGLRSSKGSVCKIAKEKGRVSKPKT